MTFAYFARGLFIRSYSFIRRFFTRGHDRLGRGGFTINFGIVPVGITSRVIPQLCSRRLHRSATLSSYNASNLRGAKVSHGILINVPYNLRRVVNMRSFRSYWRWGNSAA